MPSSHLRAEERPWSPRWAEEPRMARWASADSAPYGILRRGEIAAKAAVLSPPLSKRGAAAGPPPQAVRSHPHVTQRWARHGRRRLRRPSRGRQQAGKDGQAGAGPAAAALPAALVVSSQVSGAFSRGALPDPAPPIDALLRLLCRRSALGAEEGSTKGGRGRTARRAAGARSKGMSAVFLLHILGSPPVASGPF